MMDGPFLWYLNRSTGFVILALFTISTALGVLSTGSRAGRRIPSFVSQSLHRNVSLLAMAMLVVHIVSAVVDSFVDIRWWQSFVPWLGSTYLPLWLGLGTLAWDLFLVVTVTSVLRARMRHRSWRLVHLTSYLAWLLCLAHGIGIGTDVKDAQPWAYVIIGSCIAVVLGAVGLRLGRLAADRALSGASL
jgi:methionine sulfoxide reductase heme-binding subunit